MTFDFPQVNAVYQGKVRDVYFRDQDIIIFTSDRISAFDHILPAPIPYKGQILNQIAQFFLKDTADLVPNWFEASPDPNISIGKKCEPIRLEMVVRGYLAGHAWRTYRDGGRVLCGVTMPEGMKEADKFEQPIITPATKAEEGHDEDISASEILERKIVTEAQWSTLVDYSLKLFEHGSRHALRQGLILVDTKYEFGLYDDDIFLIDEIHTPDSSRYYYLDGYAERQREGKAQKQLSKEFVREWLMQNGFQGLEGQAMPDLTDDFIADVSNRYIELYEKLTGKQFVPRSYTDFKKDVESRVVAYYEELN